MSATHTEGIWLDRGSRRGEDMGDLVSGTIALAEFESEARVSAVTPGDARPGARRRVTTRRLAIGLLSVGAAAAALGVLTGATRPDPPAS